jgi:hypothetical protein
VFLITEATKLVLNRIAAIGNLNSLTQAQAEATLKSMTDGLSVNLPTPAQLENPTS